MATVRKVQSKIKLTPKVQKAAEVEPETIEEEAKEPVVMRPRRGCQFCGSKTEPRYWDANALRRFLNDRGRILPKMRTGTCTKHQRRLGREIKHARQLSLLPFEVKV
ncbi:30S ribosomal protein S18 [Candidatus Daviesbacteria bacterium]|nr:30S ribosomal protein S18 [Candidatus Daviesbacteria bacterium]